jgi:DNA topoisomerase I
MRIAQHLYEAGHITYMRTDSTNLSEMALQTIGAEVTKLYGADYHKLTRYKTKNESAQEAHEAIRPTYVEKQNVSGDRDEQRLYELIWKRTMASQMADAELEKTTVDIAITPAPSKEPKGSILVAEGEVLKFDGFLKVYLESTDDEEEEGQGMLPPLAVGQALKLSVLTAMERFTRPAARYTEAGLVKKLEELGIGRPSTYAPTISKIMEENRGYVTKESREGEQRAYRILTLKSDQITDKTATEVTGTTKNVLYPSDMGMIVTDFLDQHFDKVMDYGFTADIEARFDDIADGKLNWSKMIDGFYKPFHVDVEKTLQEAERASGERILGIDPASGRTVLVRMSSLGKAVIQIGTPAELEPKEKPRYANLRAGRSMETVTLAEALESFALPRTLGEYLGQEMSVNTGRYGPYIKYGESTFVNLPKAEDPFEISYERALVLLQAKLEADKPAGEYQNIPYTLGKGRFGPYLKWGELFVNIPARYNLETLTAAHAAELIAAKIEKEGNRFIQNWEAEKISIENGRWGPFIRFGKIMFTPKFDGVKMTMEQAQAMTLEEVKKLIEIEAPGAFDKKPKGGKKK